MCLKEYSYPNLAAVKAESTELLMLIEAASYGYAADREEEYAAQKAQLESMMRNG